MPSCQGRHTESVGGLVPAGESCRHRSAARALSPADPAAASSPSGPSGAERGGAAAGGGGRGLGLPGLATRSSSLRRTVPMQPESASAWLEAGGRLRCLPGAQGPGCPALPTGLWGTPPRHRACTNSTRQLCSIGAARLYTAGPLPPAWPPPRPGTGGQRGALLTPRLAGTTGWVRAVAAVSLSQTHRTELAAKRQRPTALCQRLGEHFGSAACPRGRAAPLRPRESRS